MSEVEVNRVRLELFAEARKDLLARELSNAERFDSAILTLSTAALGVSLAFIKDVVALQSAERVAWLIGSWWLFGCAIVTTLLSFVASQLGLRRQLRLAEEYYLGGQEESLNARNAPARATDWLFYLAGVFFVAALGSTIYFVTGNL
jgi:uncharacterized membrane protein